MKSSTKPRTRRTLIAAGGAAALVLLGSGIAFAGGSAPAKSPAPTNSVTDPAGGPNDNVQQGSQTAPDVAGAADPAETPTTGGAVTDPAGGPNDGPGGNVQQGDQTTPDAAGTAASA